MAKKCECGGWIVKEINPFKTVKSYLGNGYGMEMTYPITKPTVRMVCIKCGKQLKKEDTYDGEN